MNKKKAKAVCLFSGGLDSSTVLYYALSKGYRVFALTVDYGQRHVKEIQAARKIAGKLAIEHRVVKMGLPWGGSALTDRKIAVPKKKKMRIGKKIPITYVPSRNIIFLSFAFSWAEVLGARTVFMGANQLDFSGYPDCRGEFLRSFEKTIRVGTKMGSEGNRIQIKAPLLKLTKKKIVELALKLKVPYEETWSCYSGGKRPCGRCESCLLRKRGFQEAGIGSP